jgi:tRNA threonylcarbamoyladenosine modification (KEOPS) complex  Pcc1 subunit
MQDAEIRLQFDSQETAEMTLQAVSPDNVPLPPGLEIKSECNKSEIIIIIRSTRGIDSFRATIEDLMSAISLALRTSDAVE